MFPKILLLVLCLSGALRAEPLSEPDRELLAKLKSARNQTEVENVLESNFWMAQAHTGGLNAFLKRTLGNGFATLPPETQATILRTSRSREFSILNPDGMLAKNAHLFDVGTLLGVELDKMSPRLKRPTYVELIRPEHWPVFSVIFWPMLSLTVHTLTKDPNPYHLLQNVALTPMVTLATQKVVDILLRSPEQRRRDAATADFVAIAEMFRQKNIPITEALIRKFRGSIGENFYRLLHKGDGAMDTSQLPKIAKLRDVLRDLAENGEFENSDLKTQFKQLSDMVAESVKQVELMGKAFRGNVAKDMPEQSQSTGGIVGLAEDAARRHIERTKAKTPPVEPPVENMDAAFMPAGATEEPSEFAESLARDKEHLVAKVQDKATPNRIALYMKDGNIILELPVDQYGAFEQMEADQKAAFMESLMTKPGVWLHSLDNPGYFRFIAPDDFKDIGGDIETEFSLWTRPIGKNRKMLLSVSQQQDDVFTKDAFMTAFQADCAANYKKTAGD